MSDSGELLEVTRKSLEDFSRELLLLVKSVRVYPEGHPTIDRLCDKLSAWRPEGGGSTLEIDVYASELVVNGHPFGTEGSRTAELATLLSRNGIKSFAINCGVTAPEIKTFAASFAEELSNGEQQLRKFLSGEGFLETGEHQVGEIDTNAAPVESSGEDFAERLRRAQTAWMWLQRQDAPPDALAGALTTAELWEVGDASGASQLAETLIEVGVGLDEAVARMDDGAKHATLGRLANLGKQIESGILIGTLLKSTGTPALKSGAIGTLLRGAGVGKLVDVMAGIIAAEGPKSSKLVALHSRFTRRESEKALALVRNRMASGDDQGHPSLLWQQLEAILLGIDDVAFADEESGRSARSGPGGVVAVEAGSIRAEVDFTIDPEDNLDLIYLSLALSGGGLVADGWEDLYGRIALLSEKGPAGRVLSLAEKVDAVTPVALNYKPKLLERILDCALAYDSKPTPQDRQRFVRFIDRHRDALAETLIIKLADAKRASHRKMLVEALSGLSKDMTPFLVSKARRGPWYMTRNLLIILGRRADPASMPYIVAAVDHEEPRIARQALRSLAAFGGRGLEALGKIVREESRNQELRDLARKISERLAP